MKISKLNAFLSTLNFVLLFIGYQFVTSLFLPLTSDLEGISRTITVPYRFVTMLISILVIILNIKRKREFKSFGINVLLLYWTMLIIRMFYDIYLNPDIYIQGSYRLWMYVFGICLPAVFSVMKSIHVINLKKTLNWILLLTFLVIVINIISNPDILGSASKIASRQSANLAMNSIAYGHLGAMGLILSIYYLIKNKLSFIAKLITIVIMLLASIIMLRAGSRSPIAAFIVVMLFWSFSSGKTFFRGVVILSIFSLLLVVFINPILQIIGDISPVIEWRLRTSIYEGDTSNRMPLYIEALQRFSNHPILGDRFSLQSNVGEIIYSHNIILDSLMGLGIIGGTAMVYVLIKALKLCYKMISNNDSNLWIALILIQQITFMMFSSSFYYNPLLSALLTFVFIYEQNHNNYNTPKNKTAV